MSVTIKNLVIGEGRPKICVPLVSENLEDLEKECEGLKGLPFDMVEWRVDHFMNQENFQATEDLEKGYRAIRAALPDTVLLTTVRTKSQGGAHKIPGGEYLSLLSLIIDSRFADLVDVEFGHEPLDTKVLLSQAKKKGMPTLMSYHKWRRPMTEMEMVDVLENMKAFKTDILKLAIMPRDTVDVAAVMNAAARVGALFPETPIIGIAMGGIGKVTRVSGNSLGAPITYAAGKEASAPGQLTCQEADAVLNVLYGK